MDMDDPWGSPWAHDVQNSLTATEETGNQEPDGVRPRTSVKALASTLVEEANSPWDDEDVGFGDWAAAQVGKGARGQTLGFDGAGDVWETRESMENRDTIKGDLNGLSPRWNNHTSIPDDDILQLSPSLMPKSADNALQPSPDPWTTGTTFNDNHHEEDSAELERKDKGVDDVEESLIKEIPIPQNSATDEVEPHIEPLPGPEAGESTAGRNDLLEASEDHLETVPEPTEIPYQGTIANEADHESSRPSSSPSDHSHHDEVLCESPRTSFDEEPKRPQILRKVSSKVQELVEHFDGLGKLDEGIVQPSRSRRHSNSPSMETRRVVGEEAEKCQEDDFGDFEEGQSDADDPTGTGEEEIPKPATPTPTQSQAASNSTPTILSPQSTPSPNEFVKKEYGRVGFTVDPSALDKFCTQPSGDTPLNIPAEKLVIPDTIPHDTFSSTEQRKTWYRISRYGTMRKHNSGDDENYIRVTWAPSQVREETLKTVARWMEEDRISGRVVLGGGSKVSSMFGWNDPNAQAIPLASAFAAMNRGKKTPPAEANVEGSAKAVPEISGELVKALVKDCSASKSRSPAEARRRSSIKPATISGDIKPSSQLPVANFGWNITPSKEESRPPIPLSNALPQAAPRGTPNPPSYQRQSSSSSQPSPAMAILAPVESTQPKKTTHLNGLNTLLPTTKTLMPVLPQITAPTSNEDDDWGEMMSSPVITTPPVFPPSLGPGHKKSQSLSGGFSPPLQASATDSQVTLPSLRRGGHRPTMSFHEILVPKPRSPTLSRPDPFLSNNVTATSPSTFSNPFNEPRKSTIPIPPATTSTDPWASADFSFFDTVPALPPKPAITLVSKPVSSNYVSSGKEPATPSPLRHGKTRQEFEQDQILASIVKGLPDLSYMLRR